MKALVRISMMPSKHACPVPKLLWIRIMHMQQRWWDPEWRRQELARRGAGGEGGSPRQELDASAMEARARALKDSRDQDELQVRLAPQCSAPRATQGHSHNRVPSPAPSDPPEHLSRAPDDAAAPLLLCCNPQIRENYGREGAEQIHAIAARAGLHRYSKADEQTPCLICSCGCSPFLLGGAITCCLPPPPPPCFVLLLLLIPPPLLRLLLLLTPPPPLLLLLLTPPPPPPLLRPRPAAAAADGAAAGAGPGRGRAASHTARAAGRWSWSARPPSQTSARTSRPGGRSARCAIDQLGRALPNRGLDPPGGASPICSLTLPTPPEHPQPEDNVCQCSSLSRSLTLW